MMFKKGVQNHSENPPVPERVMSKLVQESIVTLHANSLQKPNLA